MGVLFADSFDNWGTTSYQGKWNDISATNISIGTGRWGSSGVNIARPTSGLSKTLAANKATLVAGVAVKPTGVANNIPIHVFSDNGTVQVVVGIRSSDSKIAIYRGTMAAGTLLATSTNAVSTGVWTHCESRITFHNTAGEVSLQINGSPETLSFVTGTSTTQNTRASANNYANQYGLCGGSSNATGSICDFDDLVVSDGSLLGDQRVEAVVPVGAGFSTQFTPSTGSNYQNVDDSGAPDGDSTYNASSTSGHIDSFSTGNVTATSGTITAVQVSTYARRDDAQAVSLKPHWRIGGSSYPGTGIALGTDFAHQVTVYDVSPATSSAWTITEVNAAEVGYQRS